MSLTQFRRMEEGDFESEEGFEARMADRELMDR